MRRIAHEAMGPCRGGAHCAAICCAFSAFSTDSAISDFSAQGTGTEAGGVGAGTPPPSQLVTKLRWSSTLRTKGIKSA